MMTVDYLKGRFGAKEDKGLAAILCKSPGAVANWRKAGTVPASVQLLARGLLGDNQAELERLLGEKDGKQPHTISELSANYSPEAKTIADTIEIIIDGKTEDERRDMVKEIMATIWKKYS
jgi:hypothetical protein